VVSVTPARVADSRTNQQITGAVPAMGTATVQVTGQGGVPAGNVAAVVLNVTVVSPQTAGYITVWPFGIDKTNTSNLNFQAGQNIPNTVIVPVGTGGKIQLFNGSAGSAHLLVDVTGYTLTGDDPAQSGLNAMEDSSDNVFVQSTENTVPAAAIQSGFRMWQSNLGNQSQTAATNATISVESGYSALLFDSVIEFPFASSTPILAPGQMFSGGNLRPKFGSPANMIAVSYSLGFDSRRTAASTIPVGGTQHTVAVTVKPTDPRYASSPPNVWAGFNIQLNANVPGVTVVSTAPPGNLDEGEQIRGSANQFGLFQWQLGMPRRNKSYTFTAVLYVPNVSAAPFVFQPAVMVGGSRQTVVCQSCTGSAVTVIDPTLDGTIPGSGAVTFSVAEPNFTWATYHSDSFNVSYQGSMPAEG
jgi:hypothetical protein